MEKNIAITDTSHNKIYQTYLELKKKLPQNFLKIKLFSSPKYTLNKKPILKKIENDKININYKYHKPSSVDKFINGNRNIYILSDKTIKLKNIKKKTIPNEHKYEEIMKKTLLTEKDKNTINNNYEKSKNNNEMIDDSEDALYQGYNFHSSIVTDVQMKNNIYLPRIIDRMKYNVPRNERDKYGFHVEGVGIFNNNKIKYDEKNDNYEININGNNLENNENIHENN